MTLQTPLMNHLDNQGLIKKKKSFRNQQQLPLIQWKWCLSEQTVLAEKPQHNVTWSSIASTDWLSSSWFLRHLQSPDFMTHNEHDKKFHPRLSRVCALAVDSSQNVSAKSKKAQQMYQLLNVAVWIATEALAYLRFHLASHWVCELWGS